MYLYDRAMLRLASTLISLNFPMHFVIMSLFYTRGVVFHYRVSGFLCSMCTMLDISYPYPISYGIIHCFSGGYACAALCFSHYFLLIV